MSKDMVLCADCFPLELTSLSVADVSYDDEAERRHWTEASTRSLRRHVNCQECGAKFKDTKKLLSHIRTIHRASIEHFCQVDATLELDFIQF